MRVTKYNVLIKVDAQESESAAGIITKEEKFSGEVVQIGDGVKWIHVGDKVSYHEHAGVEVSVENEKHLILGARPDAGQIIAIL